ncbi:Os08g0227900, partial [Oryza sativa Japonica Group]
SAQVQHAQTRLASLSLPLRSNTMEMVIGTPEYDQLKSLYPSLLIELLESVCILCK